MNFRPERQQIESIHPEILNALDFGYTQPANRPSIYEPTNVFAAIGAAARLRRKQRALGAQQILTQTKVDFGPQTIFEMLLQDILNQSLDPALQSDFNTRACKEYDTSCITSEHLFGKAIAALEVHTTRSATYNNEYGVRIIAKDTEPLFVHKMEGSKTALSLKQLTVDGILYPAGSIMGIHVRDDLQPKTGRYTPQVEPNALQVIDAQEVVGADFLRPSLFMAPPTERKQYLDTEDFFMYAATHPVGMYRVQNYNLEEIVKVAQEAIEQR